MAPLTKPISVESTLAVTQAASVERLHVMVRMIMPVLVSRDRFISLALSQLAPLLPSLLHQGLLIPKQSKSGCTVAHSFALASLLSCVGDSPV